MPTIFESNANTTIEGLTLPDGWKLQSALPIANASYQWIYQGPYSSCQAAYDAIHDKRKSATLSTRKVSDGIAEITVTWVGSSAGADAGVVADDGGIESWDLSAVTVPTALEAHPGLETVKAAYLSAIDALGQGRVAEAAAIVANSDAAPFVGLWLAGCKQYDVAGYTYSYTREYDAVLLCNEANYFANSGIENALTVVAWTDVKGSGSAPFAEPKYQSIGANGSVTAMAYEWRQEPVRVSQQGNVIRVTFVYTGAWKWARKLYPGGSWNPQLPGISGGADNE